MAPKDQVVRLLIVEDSMETAEQLISTLRNALLVMLCSNQSHFVNGAVIAADDGFGV